MWFLDFWDFWEFQLVFPPLLTHCVGWCAGAVFVCIRNEGTTVERQVGDGGMRVTSGLEGFPTTSRAVSDGIPRGFRAFPGKRRLFRVSGRVRGVSEGFRRLSEPFWSSSAYFRSCCSLIGCGLTVSFRSRGAY